MGVGERRRRGERGGIHVRPSLSSRTDGEVQRVESELIPFAPVLACVRIKRDRNGWLGEDLSRSLLGRSGCFGCGCGCGCGRRWGGGRRRHSGCINRWAGFDGWILCLHRDIVGWLCSGGQGYGAGWRGTEDGRVGRLERVRRCWEGHVGVGECGRGRRWQLGDGVESAEARDGAWRLLRRVVNMRMPFGRVGGTAVGK